MRRFSCKSIQVKLKVDEWWLDYLHAVNVKFIIGVKELGLDSYFEKQIFEYDGNHVKSKADELYFT